LGSNGLRQGLPEYILRLSSLRGREKEEMEDAMETIARTMNKKKDNEKTRERDDHISRLKRKMQVGGGGGASIYQHFLTREKLPHYAVKEKRGRGRRREGQ